MTEYLLVISSCPDKESADTIARELVGHQLAACVHITQPVQAIYRWEGELCQSTEVQLHIKCLSAQYQAIEAKISQIHPYDVPELIALPITAGSEPYLQWIKETTQS